MSQSVSAEKQGKFRLSGPGSNIEERIRDNLAELTASERSNLLRLARQSIAHGLATDQPIEPQRDQLVGNLAQLLASFVTLTLEDELRGCVGSTEARDPLARGVALAAFSAAFRDHRFSPLPESDFAQTRIEISVLSRPRPILIDTQDELLNELVPGQDGLIVDCDGQRATFLPKVWQKVPSASEFLKHLLVKANLPQDHWSDSLEFYRYTTVTFAESPN